MHKYGRIFLFILASLTALGIPQTARAQSPAPRFTRLTAEQGLSHDMVTAILQDRQGFLWFGTQDGLNRYDGYTFTVYRHLRSDPQSLASSTINALYEDRAGTLWVGTVAGLDSFTGIGGRFTHHSAIPPESIGAIYQDDAGALWVGTVGSGLFRYDPATGAVTAYRHDPADPTSLSDNNVLTIFQDRAGTLWVGTMYGGLNALDPATGRFAHYRHDPTDPTSLTDGWVRVITQDRGTGEAALRPYLWVGTGVPNDPVSGGLNALDPATGRVIRYRHDPADPHSLSHNHVRAIYEDSTGALWVGTEDGLNLFDPATGRFTHYRHDPLDPHSLSRSDVSALYESRDGVLWVGMDGGGVNKYARARQRFPRYAHDPLDPNSLGGPVVGALLLDHEGILWIGLHDRGLDRLDRATGRFTHYTHDPADPDSLGHNHVTALCEDHTHNLWVGTGGGLDRLDRATGRFIHYVHDPADPYTIGPGAVKVIIESRDHTLWIGTEEPGTLNRFDPATGRFTRYQYDPSSPSGFVNTYGIRAIYEDRAGDLWLGTYNGLVHFDPRTGRFIQYRHDPENPDSLSHDFVWAIYEDETGMLWVGTHGGLNRFDRATGRFTAYTVEDGLPNDAVVAVLGEGDHEGRPYIWLATMGGGVSRFDPRTETFKNYDVGDGLQSNQFVIGAYHRGRDGEIFLGGINGFNAFYPSDIQDNPHVPPVVLTGFRKFDQVVDLGLPLAEVREITLSYRDNFFSFEFAALDYTEPARNQYAYKLEGFDRDWVYCGTRRYAGYTNLPPDRYVFRVKGSNNDGVWNEAGVSVEVRITPPFWQTWWFRGLMAAVVLSIGMSVYTVRAQNVAALREREERFRTLFESAPLCVFEADLAPTPPRVLRANPQSERVYGWPAEEWASVSLGQIFPAGARPDLERMTERLRAGETVHLESTHRRRDGNEFPVRVSAAPERAPGRKLAIVVVEDITAEKAWRSEEEAIAEERRRIAREIHDGLAQDLASLRMRARLWHQLVDEAPQQMHAEIDALRGLLRQNIREVRRAIFALRPLALDELGFWPALHRFLDEFGEQNQLHVSLEARGIDEALPALTPHLELVLFRIIQETLNNVAKHAQATTVWVELNVEETGSVCLTVRDDGVGFDPAILDQAIRSGHVGLKQMRERVAVLKGTFTLSSKPGHGTEICITLPLER